MNNLDMNIFFIVTAIILLIYYYNENKVVEYFSPCVVTRRQYQGTMTAKQCQDNCENKRYGRTWWGTKWPCKYAVMTKGIHNTGKRGKCWHTTGKDQFTMNKNCDRQYDVWKNKNYKKPEIWNWKTIRLGNMGTVWHPRRSTKKSGFIFPDRKERKVRKFRWKAYGRDQGWGNRTRASNAILYNRRGGNSGWVGGWKPFNVKLPRLRRGGRWQSKTKNFSRPYPKFDRYYGISTSRGQGHRNITSYLQLEVNYLED